MENSVTDDCQCRIALNLNDDKDEHAVIDLRLNKDDDYYSVLYDDLARKELPLLLLDEVAPLMSVMMLEQRKVRRFYRKEDREAFRRAVTDEGMREFWTKAKALDEEVTDEGNVENWKKVALLRYYGKDEEMRLFENKVRLDMEIFEEKRNEEEMMLSLQQEKEMKEVNMNDISNEIVANEHLCQLRQFKSNSRRELAELLVNSRDIYLKLVNETFFAYQESIDVYNKLLPMKQISNSSLLSQEAKEKNKTPNEINLLFKTNLSFGIIHRKSISISLYAVPDLINHNLKAELSTSKPEVKSLNEIFSSSIAFGNDLHALLNFFTYDSNDKALTNLLSSSKVISQEVTNELFFDSSISVFLQLENIITQTEQPPNCYDIITTKHSNMPGFDLMLNLYLPSINYITEEDLSKALEGVIYFANAYRISTLIIPLDKIMLKVYRCGVDGEFKPYVKHFKSLLAMINQACQTVIKLGVRVMTNRIVFETLNSFALAFEKCGSFDGFSLSFNNCYVKG